MASYLRVDMTARFSGPGSLLRRSGGQKLGSVCLLHSGQSPCTAFAGIVNTAGSRQRLPSS
jgi:hypothetical protein